MSPQADPVTLDGLDIAMVILATAVHLGVIVLLLVLAGIDYRGFLPHWRRGVLIGLGLATLSVPGVLLDAWYYDPRVALPPGSSSDPMMLEVLRATSIAAAIVGLAILVPWTMVAYYIARYEWGLVPRRTATPARAAGVGVGVAAGVALGVLSMALFYAFDIGLSPMLRNALRAYPGIEEAPTAILLPTALLVGLVAAVSEELQYRGALLGFFTRVTGNGEWAFWLVNLGVAVAFGTLHLVNADAPLLKFGQIFALSLVLGVLVRWAGLWSAIACHASMNVVAVLATVLLGIAD